MTRSTLIDLLWLPLNALQLLATMVWSAFWISVALVVALACSIGVEIVNPGHEFGYRAFPDAQIETAAH